MLNMIKLEWLCMRSFQKRGFMLLFGWIAMGILFHPASMLLLMPFTMFDFGSYSFLAGEKGEVDRLYLTLPINRKTVVRARFGLMAITGGIGLISGIIVTFAASTLLYGRTTFADFSFSLNTNTIFLLIASSMLVCGFMSLSTFPKLCKVGWVKGKNRGYLIPGAVITLLFIVGLLGNRFEVIYNFSDLIAEWLFANTVWTTIILLCAAVVLFVVSYMKAQKNYGKREF